MTYVLDSSAMIAFLNGEQGAQDVAALLMETDAVCLAHAINLCEIYYQIIRENGEAAAELTISKLSAIGIRADPSFDDGFWKQAGKIKAAFPLSLADAIGLTLAIQKGGEFVTSDHHELDRLAATGNFPIRFFR